jgi:transposase
MAIAAEAALDGVYIIRTSVSAEQMSEADCVRNYKSLSNVERAFRSFKTMDLKVRPIHHRLADRVRSPMFENVVGENGLEDIVMERDRAEAPGRQCL